MFWIRVNLAETEHHGTRSWGFQGWASLERHALGDAFRFGWGGPSPRCRGSREGWGALATMVRGTPEPYTLFRLPTDFSQVDATGVKSTYRGGSHGARPVY